MPTHLLPDEYSDLAVFEWRKDQLERAGIRTAEAIELALSRADLHAMLDAKEAGCDIATLCRIFVDDVNLLPPSPKSAKVKRS